MTGLSVLYASEAAKEADWAAVPDRDRTGRLREVYWASRAELESGRKGRKRLVNATLNWWADRTAIGRRSDEPGDGFVYLVSMVPRVEDQFEWLEVTEVYTTVPASRIEGAMRAWNGISDKHPVDFEEFRRGLRRGRPSRIEQRSAADRVIDQIERKLSKTSYHELLERYGYGTLVVGMPLWFAVPPDDPFRAMNAIDDFMTRTALGLEVVKRQVLGRQDCPFSNVIVTWDTTPQALREWRMGRSSLYEDTTNASLENLMGARLCELLSRELEAAISKTGTPESEAPSMSLRLDIKTKKKALGKGPYPKPVEALRKVLPDGNDHPMGRWATSVLDPGDAPAAVQVSVVEVVCWAGAGSARPRRAELGIVFAGRGFNEQRGVRDYLGGEPIVAVENAPLPVLADDEVRLPATVARAAAEADDQELRLVLAIVGADVVMLDAVEEVARVVLRSVVKYPLIWL